MSPTSAYGAFAAARVVLQSAPVLLLAILLMVAVLTACNDSAASGEPLSKAYIKSVELELVAGSSLIAVTIYNSEVKNDLYLECTFKDNQRGRTDTERYKPVHIDMKTEQLFEFLPAAAFPGIYETACDLKEKGLLSDATHDEGYEFTIDVVGTHLADPQATISTNECGPSSVDKIVMYIRRNSPQHAPAAHGAEFFVWDADNADKNRYGVDRYQSFGGGTNTLHNTADIERLEPGSYILDCILFERLNAFGSPPNYLDRFEPIIWALHAVEVVGALRGQPSFAFLPWKRIEELNGDRVQQIYTTTFTVNEDLSITNTVPQETVAHPAPTPQPATAATTACDSEEGGKLWRYETGGGVHSSPTVADGVVYAGSDDDHLYGLDTATGDLLWRYETGGDVRSSPTVADGVVYVGSNDDHLYALDAATGDLLWRYETSRSGHSSPTVVDGVVYVGSNFIMLLSLDAATGDRLWLRYGVGKHSSPTVADGVVYVESDDDHLYAVKAGTRKGPVPAATQARGAQGANLNPTCQGELMWLHEVGQEPTGSYGQWWSLAVEGILYAMGSIDEDEYFYALNASTGDLNQSRGEIRRKMG